MKKLKVDSVTGTVTIYSGDMAVGKITVNEKKLVYGMERVFSIYPIPKYATPTSVSYSLTVSDGGTSTLNTGVKVPLS